MNKLSQAIKEAATRGEKLYLSICVVDSVDENNRTIVCTPITDGAQRIVNMQASIEGAEGILIVPEVGSTVIIGYVDRHNAFVLTHSKIEKISIDTKNIIINQGENGGIVISEKVTDEINTVLKRVNYIVRALQTLAATMTGTGQAPVLGAALGTAINSAISQIMMPLQDVVKTNLENDKITH